MSRRTRRQARSDPRHLSHALGELITARGLAGVRGHAQLAEAWRAAAGPAVSQRTRVQGLQRGVLLIAVDSAPLLSELVSFARSELLERIQSGYPHLRIRDLNFRLQGR